MILHWSLLKFRSDEALAKGNGLNAITSVKNPKLQIISKLQFSMTKTSERLRAAWNFEFWSL